MFEEQRSQIHIPGHSLSSGCGDHYFRCQGDDLLVETLYLQDGRAFEVIFIPLENGLLLLSHWYDSNSQRVPNCTWNTTALVNLSCSPTVTYNVNGKFYIVCISSTSRHISAYEVRLHLRGTVLESATLLGPLTEVRISSLLSTSHLPNFVLVQHVVYFAIGNSIVAMNFLDSIQTQQYPELSECTQIHKLVSTTSAGNQQLLMVYCTDQYFYFDPMYGDWTSQYLFLNSGVPYLCPDNNYRATLFNSILQFSVRDSLSYTVNNVNISSGNCFNSQNRTYFAYSDQQHYNVYVYNFTTQNYYPVSTFDCLNMECPQLLLLGNRYMIIHDANNVAVLDTIANFSLVMNMTSVSTQTLFAVSHMIPNDVSTVVPPITNIQTNLPITNMPTNEVSTSTNVPIDIQTNIPDDNAPASLPIVSTTDSDVPITEHSESSNLQLALIIVGSIAALVIIINIFAITLYIFKRYRKSHR